MGPRRRRRKIQSLHRKDRQRSAETARLAPPPQPDESIAVTASKPKFVVQIRMDGRHIVVHHDPVPNSADVVRVFTSALDAMRACAVANAALSICLGLPDEDDDLAARAVAENLPDILKAAGAPTGEPPE